MNSAAGVVVLPPLRPISIREFRIQCMEHWVCSRNLNRNWFVRLEYDNNVLSKVAGHTEHSECSVSTDEFGLCIGLVLLCQLGDLLLV